MEMLTTREAFEAMVEFLAQFYSRTKSDDVGGLLGDIQMRDDGLTADPAAWHDWLKCVSVVTRQRRR